MFLFSDILRLKLNNFKIVHSLVSHITVLTTYSSLEQTFHD